MGTEIYKYPSYYLIKNVYKVPKAIENDLAKWNNVYHKLEKIGYVYDKEQKELRIPRGYSEENLLNIFYDSEIINKDSPAYEKVDISLTCSPRDYIQEQTFSFMVGENNYANTRKETQLYTDLDTGLGKTFIMIATCCYFRSRMVVITPAISKIEDQWMESIGRFTSLNRSEYLNVTGSKMCSDIIDGKYKNVKIFVIPRSTILAFVRKYEDRWDMVTKLIDAMHVNIKAIDEAHMDFHTVVSIDCYTNVGKTYYMSSSPSRSEKSEKIIYAKIFKNVLRYGKKILTKEQKHIIPIIFKFKSTPTENQLNAISTRYGPSLSKYGDYLLDPDGARDEFLEAYTYTLYELLKYRRRNGKVLILCVTIDFAKQLQEYTKTVFPYLSSGLFIGSGKDKNKELDNDLIFSTIKSMGTGSEIENHQLTINTLTYSSAVLADQISGRIREQINRKGIYAEIVNIAHKVANNHYIKRLPYLERKAKNGKVIEYPINDIDLNKMYNFFKNEYRFGSDGEIITKEGYILLHRHLKK